MASQLKTLAQQSGQDIGQLIVAQKILDEEDLAKARAAFFNMPYIDLHSVHIPAEVLSLIPQESVNFYNFVPFELSGRNLKVAITDPTNLSALEALEFLGQKQNLQVQLYLASETSVGVIIGKKQNLKRVVGEALKDIQTKEATQVKPTEEKKKPKRLRLSRTRRLSKLLT